MRVARVANVAAVLMAVLSANVRGQEGPAAIERVELGANREFRVNGQPFFPLMAWLQDADNFPDVRACGMNTVAGYWPGSSGTQNVAQYLELAKQAGLYGVMPYAAELKGRPNLLAYIQGDEPDLPRQVSDAEIVPAEGLRLNASTPLWKILDGVTHSWSVLDPLAGAAITIRLEKPVTVDSLAVWLTISNGLSVAKDVVFQGDGRVILEAQLEQKKGQQRFALAAPATFRELKLTVRTTYAGQQVWGSIERDRRFPRRRRQSVGGAASLRAAEAVRRDLGGIRPFENRRPCAARVHDPDRQLPPAFRQMERFAALSPLSPVHSLCRRRGL